MGVTPAAGYDFAAVGAIAGIPVNVAQRVTAITFVDTSAVSNTVQVYDNTSGSGHLVAAVTLAASGGATVTDIDVAIGKGLFIVATGAVKGTAWLA